MDLSPMDEATSLKDSLSYHCDGRIVGAQSGVIAPLARSQSASIPSAAFNRVPKQLELTHGRQSEEL